MTINTTMCPTHDITIGGHQFSVPEPFSEGYVLREIDAATLNQTYAENLRNNFAARVKKANEDAKAAGTEVDLDVLREEFSEYVASYDFGVRRGGGTARAKLNPVDAEAKRIAESHVKAALKKKGIAFKDVDKANFAKIVADVLEQNPQIHEAAANIVAARQELGEGAFDINVN